MDTPYFNYNEFKDDFLNVYEPAEDSFLLLDALQNDMDLIKNLKFWIRYLNHIDCQTDSNRSTDINGFACETTLKCALNNGVSGKIETVNTDLSTCLDDRLKNKVDILIFNPPYVPTDDKEIDQSLLNRAWAGGKDGRVIIDKFLSKCLDLLVKDGLLYLLLINENRPDEIIDHLNSNGFDAQVVLKRRAKNELQFIIRSRRLG